MHFYKSPGSTWWNRGILFLYAMSTNELQTIIDYTELSIKEVGLLGTSLLER